MPQLDISTFAAQIFWLLICFTAILLFSSKVTLPKLDKKLRTRWQTINAAQQDALKLQQNIIKITDDYTREFNTAKQNSQSLIAQTIADINRQQAQQKEIFKAQCKQRLSEFDTQMAEKKIILSADLVTIAASSASQIIKYLTQETISQDNINKAIHQTLQQEHQHD